MNLMLRTKNTGELNVERVFARMLVLFGGAFWFFALAGLQNMGYTQVYSLPELTRAAMLGGIPLAITIGSLILGMFYERLNGTLLILAALGMLVWGVRRPLGRGRALDDGSVVPGRPGGIRGSSSTSSRLARKRFRSSLRRPRRASPIASQPSHPHAEKIDRLGDRACSRRIRAREREARACGSV